jgi:hypothetical protein
MNRRCDCRCKAALPLQIGILTATHPTKEMESCMTTHVASMHDSQRPKLHSFSSTLWKRRVCHYGSDACATTEATRVPLRKRRVCHYGMHLQVCWLQGQTDNKTRRNPRTQHAHPHLVLRRARDVVQCYGRWVQDVVAVARRSDVAQHAQTALPHKPLRLRHIVAARHKVMNPDSFVLATWFVCAVNRSIHELELWVSNHGARFHASKVANMGTQTQPRQLCASSHHSG